MELLLEAFLLDILILLGPNMVGCHKHLNLLELNVANDLNKWQRILWMKKILANLELLRESTTTFAHLVATTVLSRGITELGIYPTVDPLDSTSRIMGPNIVGNRHYGYYCLLGMGELFEGDKLTVSPCSKDSTLSFSALLSC
uniref:Uncharacterized protein n=1 Tax=Meloidogyne enterolobii TaxID=390850 RepID=A0A6V7XNX1_MELEN|nr:unnamed protein product [Meloidogyne enterolobii]